MRSGFWQSARRPRGSVRHAVRPHGADLDLRAARRCRADGSRSSTSKRPHKEADGYARGLLHRARSSAQRRRARRAAHARDARAYRAGVEHARAAHAARSREDASSRISRASSPSACRTARNSPSIPTASNTPRLWVRYPHEQRLDRRADRPAAARAVHHRRRSCCSRGALVLSLFATWQLQRPLARVAQAARRFGGGERPVPVEENGPRELRDLIGAFNQMMRKITDADDDSAVMLAGIAHDLKAPLTRLKLRASVLAKDERERAPLHARYRFDDAHRAAVSRVRGALAVGQGAKTGVDAFIAEQFRIARRWRRRRLFALSLEAGDAFSLPRTFIDRLMTNLVDNALEHGEPPVEIRTARQGGEWMIEVRDHGPGIPDERIDDALRPFVRLDPARSGNGHCGLGLTIVERLARDSGGRCEIGNAEGGGLVVRIAIPVRRNMMPRFVHAFDAFLAPRFH